MTLGEELISLAKTFRGRIKFVKVDTKDNMSLARRYRVMGVPAIFLFRSGEKIDEIRGKATYEDFTRWLEDHL